MTAPDISPEARARLRECAEKATPRPWVWRYCAGGSPQLVHPRHGLLYVMQAARKGFNGATLRFATRAVPADGGILHDAETFFQKPGNAVPDIQEPSNPDMAYLALAANLAPALLARVEALEAENERLRTHVEAQRAQLIQAAQADMGDGTLHALDAVWTSGVNLVVESDDDGRVSYCIEWCRFDGGAFQDDGVRGDTMVDALSAAIVKRRLRAASQPGGAP